MLACYNSFPTLGDNNIDWNIIGGFILFYQSWYIGKYSFCWKTIGIIILFYQRWYIVTISQY